MTPYKLSISRQAEQVLLDSALWYENQSPGLGNTFISSVDNALSSIAANPLLYGYRKNNIRGYSMKKFPFKIMFTVSGDHVYVISILHTSKKRDV
ncbi:MAG: type II toxin-antitoxin system RelE/ParE family toxin [Chitinophagaceae bacterium]|nr:type II toxin-antitoxin system RelE/ParE family toxin [Chitinophagaceae bacterium]